MPNIPPTGGPVPPPSEPVPPSDPAAPAAGAGGAQNMTEFMKLFTPEQRKKFMNILVQNLVGEISKASKKYIEELRKEREDIEKG